MLLKRVEPFAGLRRMDEDMDRMWRHAFGGGHRSPREWYGNGHLPLDVYTNADSFVIRATAPGMRPEDLEVTITDNVLTIKGKGKGETQAEKENKEETYLHREVRFGAFHRTIALPRGLDTEKAETTYEAGVLTINIPKGEEHKPKTLKINVKTLEEARS